MTRSSNKGHRSKRKYQEYVPDSRPNHYGVGDTLRDVKRARLSPEASSPSKDNSRNTNTEDGGGEWQTVRSKSSRNLPDSLGRKKRSDQRADQHADGPRVYFQDKHVASTSVIQAKELRDLALYVLADGVAPTWVAVKQVREIKKVVVVMLPGFDETMIKRAQALLWEPKADQLSNIHLGDPGTGHQNPQANASHDGETLVGSDETQKDTIGNDTIMQMEDTDLPSNTKQLTEQDMHWLFADRIPVRAPGDPKWSKVHSPLQAMLMKGFEEDSDRKNHNQAQEKAFQAVRTPITHFIHSADELREAEYPIHPATFTSQADGALEETRRNGANQTVTDGWVDTEVTISSPVIPAASKATPRDAASQGLTIYAIDCEMVLTSDDKSSLARVSLVSWPDGKVVLDKLVKPTLEITNYFTQFSGITAQILQDVTTTLADVQAELLTLFTPSTILLGHSLESDLNALKMTHPFIIDTSMIYPHPRGLPLRSSLKFLANKYLRREIQNGGANGHDSVEDARAVLDLVKLKCEKGPRWGTTEANGESVFKRISRHHGPDGRGRTTAMVEYGTPERGYGKDATVTIGCQNDEEVTAGILKAVQGTQSSSAPSEEKEESNIPHSGVDFTWGRLRGLEFARGWVTNSSPSTSSSLNPVPTTTSPSSTPTTSTQQDPDLDASLLSLLTHLQTLHTTLSRTTTPTLLVLYSGTSDMRPVLHYQAMQNQYRKEFKVKKWDELSVRWTDVEEQALRRTVEDARRGWGWVGVL